MSEAVFNKVQFGRQSAVGTAVAATTVFPVDAGWLGLELDRAAESPDEDFGRISREQPGRGSYGLRGADGSLPFVARFQDIAHILEMGVAGSVTPTGGPTYVYVYPFDETSTSLKPYTIEAGDENSTQDEHRGVGCLVNELELGFDALTAPGNAMWKGTAGIIALDRKANAMTSSQTPPTALETMEGHLTTISLGSTATAFASLTAQTSTLVSFSFNNNNNLVRRAYGGASDIASAYGRSGKAETTFEALIKIASGTKTNFMDVFDEAANIVTEQRFRVTVTGTTPNVMTIDFRARFTAVNLGDRDGERAYAVNGVWVYDSTLVSRGAITLTNLIATVP